ncbi:MAG: class I SAM-dependent methyltransferase [Pseudomonadota bacterium]
MSQEPTWERIYAAGQQLNRFPYSEAVSYFMRRWPHGVPADFTVLDIGCGSGVHTNLFADCGASVVAFDYSASAIQSAKQTYPNPNITFETASFPEFDPNGRRFDMAFDRLSTTNSSLSETRNFYQRLRHALKPGAHLFWQGFDMENTGRDFGTYIPEKEHWDHFTGGVFEPLGQTVFYSEDDLDRIFDGYEVEGKRIISDQNLQTGYRHSFWMLELRAP